MKSLQDLIGVAKPGVAVTDHFFSKYGLAKNPFPTARTIIPEVIYNQEAALEAFAFKLRDIIQATQPEKRSMTVLGGTGSGKTHFLRHCQYLLAEFQEDNPVKLVTVEFLAGSSSVVALLREILRKADDICRACGDLDFLSALINKMDDADDYSKVSYSDLRKVLHLLFRSAKPEFIPPDRDRNIRFDQLRELARKWIGGATLTQTERTYLDVYSRLSTASLMARVVSELLGFARKKNVLTGVIICLDELEALFTGQNSTAKIQQFLQDLRYLFDEAVKENTGYSLFVLTASTQTGATNLRDFNYPLFQRLGFEGDMRQALSPISDAREVGEFARTYIEYESKRIKQNPKGNLLTDAELDDARAAAMTVLRNVSARQSGSVSQAQLLEALHSMVEKKRAAAVNRHGN